MAHKKASKVLRTKSKYNSDNHKFIEAHFASKDGKPVIVARTYSKIRNFQSRMRPFLLFLQLLGFYPGKQFERRNKGIRCEEIIFIVMFIIFFVINIAITSFNISVTHVYRSIKGLLHASTISSIITGLMPLHNCINFAVISFRVRRHRRLLQHLRFVEESFRLKYFSSPNLERYQFRTILFCILSFSVAMVLRIVEYIKMDLVYGTNWLSHVSLVLVPMLRLWQLVPLFYFLMLNSLLRFWFRILNRAIKADNCCRHKPMIFYYKHFLSLTSLTMKLGMWMNPFIMFSMGVSVIILCLTIYFVTQADTLIQTGQGPGSTVVTFFNLAWATLQIVIAIFYIVALCWTGWNTNEEARKILRTVLASNADTEDDKFQVIRFVQKMSTQYSWGLSVWRAFPIERSLFFTLISTILAWALILNKLKESTCTDSSTNINLHSIKLSNSTNFSTFG